MQKYTSWVILVFCLDLVTISSQRVTMISSEEAEELACPPVWPSWVDLPLTLKVTPLGAFDLISRFAGLCQIRTKRWPKADFIRTRSNMVEVLGKELDWRSTITKIGSPAGSGPYIIG